MMKLEDFLSQDEILPELDVGSKKQLLQVLSEHASEKTGLSARQIFDTVLQREKLGSTGVGNGVAIPHGKFVNFSQIKGVFARLSTPIEFDALDDQPVDLVFLLLAPESAGADHLKALSRIARALRDPECVSAIRTTNSTHKIYTYLTEQYIPSVS